MNAHFKLASVGLEGLVQSQSGCFLWEVTEPGSTARGGDYNNPSALSAEADSSLRIGPLAEQLPELTG